MIPNAILTAARRVWVGTAVFVEEVAVLDWTSRHWKRGNLRLRDQAAFWVLTLHAANNSRSRYLSLEAWEK